MNSKDTVDRIANPSFEEFERDYRRPGKPVVITDALNGWVAQRLWSIDYFADTLGDAEITVDRISKEQAGVFDRRLTLQDRIRMRDYLAALEDPHAPELYLVATPIPVAFPSLMLDLGPLPLMQPDGRFEPALFFAKAGSKTSLHSDYPDNLHALVRGHKRVTLVDWRYSSRLYRDSVLTNRPNYSNLDVDAPDYERHPRFLGVEMLETEIHSGEILFIPSFWWHRVHTLETSIAVAHWWGGKKACLPYLRIVVFGYARGLVTSVAHRVKSRLRRA